MDTEKLPTSREFLITEGGPLYRIQRRLGLIRQDAPLVLRRAALSILLTWVVLLILSAIEHRATGRVVVVPFLHDFGAYTRFFIAVPLLIAAENIIGPRLAEAASFFVTSGIVPQKDYAAFDAAVESGLHLRDSVIAEVILGFCAYAISIVANLSMAVHVSSWNHTESGARTLAGWWQIIFCVPLMNFLLLRWVWRIFLWGQFLNRMSKLDLQLFPPHPDEAAGLGFVGRAQQFFGIVLFAYSAATAGILANTVIYDKVPLQHFAGPVAAYVVIAVILVLLPVLVFFHKLHEIRLKGLYQYSALATAYTAAFHKKWIRGENPDNDPVLGTGDIQSLADLGTGFDYVKQMDHLPINPRTPIQLALACLIPMSPLLLIIIPLKEVLKLLLKAVL